MKNFKTNRRAQLTPQLTVENLSVPFDRKSGLLEVPNSETPEIELNAIEPKSRKKNLKPSRSLNVDDELPPAQPGRMQQLLFPPLKPLVNSSMRASVRPPKLGELVTAIEGGTKNLRDVGRNNAELF